MELMLRREDESFVARQSAANFFAQCLQLNNSRYIVLEQEAPFAEITIRKGSAWEVEAAALTATATA